MTSLLAFLLMALIGCSKPESPTPPNSVDSDEVKSILLVNEATAQECEKELSRLGGKILYRGPGGLLMIDRPIEELDLKKCMAIQAPNERVRLAPPPGLSEPSIKPPDLPTILRLIPAEEIGARSFIAKNPTFDGRGIAIAVLDTGVEVDHPMLATTTDGKRKITDFEDFSGEGRTALEPVMPIGGKVKAQNGEDYSIGTLQAEDLAIGIFDGSSLAFSEDISENDTFSDLGVLGVKNSGEWQIVIDTDDDKDFSDESVLSNFAVTGKFVKIGANRSLTVSVTIRPDGRSVNLCFDDGSHGTHVAGIAAGYNVAGLQGVAPGATVIAGKIGDNRLAGGSTTTASMLLAIDWAVQKGARVINLSYGIAAGTNIGKSLIDQYVNKVAREKDILFSISAGNEGPGLQTIGTPAGADLAITNGAYLSKETARDNYGYLGFQKNGLWFFSSVGPRLDGGMKPSILAPGAALSSVPNFALGYANYRGTSMASPQTSGGLALLLSAGGQLSLPVDRVSITRSIYRSAVTVPDLKIVEQGHGLLNVNLALDALMESKEEPIVEYSLSSNSPHSPDGLGKGIFTRSESPNANPFTVTVTPIFQAAALPVVRTFRLEPSESWIVAPSNLWIAHSAKTFQVDLDPTLFNRPGLHSGAIKAIDEATGKMAFTVPVTAVVPEPNGWRFERTLAISPGTTQRLFLTVPKTSTRILFGMETSGPIVFGQILDPEGRRVIELRPPDGSLPQPRLFKGAAPNQPGVYEIDVTASPVNRVPVTVSLSIEMYGFSVIPELTAEGLRFDVAVVNEFGPAIVLPRLIQKRASYSQQLKIEGSALNVPFKLSESDARNFSSASFQTKVSKKLYDSLTDFPFRIFNPNGELFQSGGLELASSIVVDTLSKKPVGDYRLEIQGAFTFGLPIPWPVLLNETRELISPKPISEYTRSVFETGQTRFFSVDLTQIEPRAEAPLTDCATFQIDLADGRTILERDFCVTPNAIAGFRREEREREVIFPD